MATRNPEMKQHTPCHKCNDTKFIKIRCPHCTDGYIKSGPTVSGCMKCFSRGYIMERCKWCDGNWNWWDQIRDHGNGNDKWIMDK